MRMTGQIKPTKLCYCQLVHSFKSYEKTQCCVELTFIIELNDASLKYPGQCPLIPKMWLEHGSDRISNAPVIYERNTPVSRMTRTWSPTSRRSWTGGTCWIGWRTRRGTWRMTECWMPGGWRRHGIASMCLTCTRWSGDENPAGHFIFVIYIWVYEQVHSLCVDSRPGDLLRLAKGPPHHSHPSLFCQAQSEAHGPPSAMAVRKKEVK